MTRMLGTALFGFLGVTSLISGCYGLWLTARGSHEDLDPRWRFRPLFRLAGLYDSTVARRAFWLVGAVSMLVSGVFFAFMAVWSFRA
ncbi:hypothetical protein [Halorussus sp. MSC15.2]|uniref:hypothetical protein n=1 Tax=Halorussus sp. MSC15.2 TaxID=2283638 RepID=UPI0013D3E4F3|nr:hypothetical protein [Halorussus sp. MSC15.2]NEU58847.1 hypothetical protein [Halorussus sp. MSC15.2]